MTFQFQCPQCQGVLEGEPELAGQQSACPLCGTAFIIPPPLDAPQAYAPPFPQVGGVSPPGSSPPGPGAGGSVAPPSGFPQVGPSASRAAVEPPDFSRSDPDLLHIPCPQCKRELETPVEMLDQDVMCPFCESQFRLKRRDSLEFQRKQQQEQQLRERKLGNAWFNWAIVAVVLVLIFLAFLIIQSMSTVD
jgi:Zn finger protein HypA/HybF involved in hydrogenase expression